MVWGREPRAALQVVHEPLGPGAAVAAQRLGELVEQFVHDVDRRTDRRAALVGELEPNGAGVGGVGGSVIRPDRSSALASLDT